MKNRVAIYDTTLRDGSQREGISFSLADKIRITRLLDELGVDYIEGGWPGSNPKDATYFEQVHHLDLQHSKIAAFGSTGARASSLRLTPIFALWSMPIRQSSRSLARLPCCT